MGLGQTKDLYIIHLRLVFLSPDYCMFDHRLGTLFALDDIARIILLVKVELESICHPKVSLFI